MPSDKALMRAREKIRDLTGPQRCFVPIPQMIAVPNPTFALPVGAFLVFKGRVPFSVTMFQHTQSVPGLDWVHDLRRNTQLLIELQVLGLGCHSLANAQDLPPIRR